MSTIRDRRRASADDRRPALGDRIALGGALRFRTVLGLAVWWFE